MVEIHPKKIVNPFFKWGCSLDKHTISSELIGVDENGKNLYDTKRTPMGELLYKIKYRDEHTGLPDLVETVSEVLKQTLLNKKKVDFIIPVPPSKERIIQPLFLIVKEIGETLGIPVVCDSIVKRCAGGQVKNTEDPEERRRIASEGLKIQRNIFNGKNILIIDDLYQTGTSASALAEKLLKVASAKEIYFLAITRTRR